MSHQEKPAAPFHYLSKTTNPVPDETTNKTLINLTNLNSIILTTQKETQDAFDLGSKIKSQLIQHRANVEMSASIDQTSKTKQDLDELLQTSLPNDSKVPRKGNLSNIYGDYIRLAVYHHFLQTGTLLPQSCLWKEFSDEEYLMGIIAVNQDLARYSIGRATERDATSVLMARNLVDAILSHLMQYDFRNGNLRRRYDGVKYALKSCETILYELSVTGCSLPHRSNGVDEPLTKKKKVDSSSLDLLPKDELQDLHNRMEHRDELRESLIKKCRDAQKAAKNAIYSLHREDVMKACELISTCEKIVLEQLMPIVEEEPMLRYGSFANVLEEYAEAKMFYVWLVGEEKVEKLDSARVPVGKVLLHHEFTTVPLEPEEYLGGVCDLTGEIGRYAVKRGTFRDEDQVGFCLVTVMNVLYAMESLERLPGGVGKKMGQLRSTVEKMEKMMYELSLTKATGRNIKAAIEDTKRDPNDEE
jgi:predicted translin family RNA/ssDNA-binding protein